ncbi:hypothetical protein XENTR_v10007019 [Xenopus tropicalis]|nr:RING finger protein 17 isoform X3 [Xenopus tropicalis]KAE8627476.1 hypothetical protein XENTR_v10007019 [Xenopus tropicalis]KAE8627477.1 hypothetical protein XENTR_v10007019 [Xenopus tropicalis]
MSTTEMTDEEQMDMSQIENPCTKMDLPPSENEDSDKNSLASVDNQGDICQRIDEALAIASDSFQCIDEAIKTLKHLDGKNRQADKSISSVIYEEFGKISSALQKRKAFLLAEVKANSEAYSTDIDKAIQEIEEKRNYLETRVKFAEGLKESPSLSTYCDLNQLLADLKVNLNYKNVVQKYKTDIRFAFDAENLFQMIGLTGEVCSSKSPIIQMKEKSDSDSYNESYNTHKVQKKHSAKARWQRQHWIGQEVHPEYKCVQEDYFCLQKPPSLMSSNNVETSLSTPDVIIEEIINEDDNTCLPVHNRTAITPLQRIEKIWNFRPGIDIDGRKNRYRKLQKKRINSCSPLVQKSTASTELVNLVYLVNPCNFYIRRYSQTKQAVILDKILKTLSSKDRPSSIDLLVLGEIIAINSMEHHSWCRGKIITLIPLENKYNGKPCGPTQYKIEDVLLLKVFLLDYGSTEVFSAVRYVGNNVSRTEDSPSQYNIIKNLCDIIRKFNLPSEAQLRSAPPLAIQCSLVDIVPANPEGLWTAKCKEECLKLVNNKCVEMKVFKEEDNKLFVDLKKPSSYKSSSNIPASLRDALVFLELARFHLPGAAEESILPRSLNPPVVPEHRTNFTVVVSHVNSPSDFYIQVADNANEYATFSQEIQEVYNCEESDLKIKHAVIGQVCMKKFKDGYWYRAVVVGFTGQDEVTIKFVDFGDTDTVNVSTLRDIKEEFLDMPCKAICCRLAFIEPCNNAQRWSLEACRYFAKVADQRPFHCNSFGVLLDNKLSVELFEMGLESGIGINTKMIELKYASLIPGSPGLSSQQSAKTEVWDTPTILYGNHMECDEISLFREKALDVVICNAESPGKIYFRWLSSESYMKRLQSRMAEKYETSNPETVQWKVEMYVAVQIPVTKQWRRGLIKNIVSDRLVQVYYYDFGMKDLVDIINIRTLEDSLKELGNLCLECSLMDIKPAGGSENWTATACDFLSFYLNGAVAKITIEENTSQYPLPVKIWRKDEAGQEVDISDYLVRQGLALKLRGSELQTVGKVIENCTSVTDVHDLIKLTLQYDPEKIVSETKIASGHLESDELMSEQNLIEPYMPPRIPDSVFNAKVSFIDGGIIYVIPESIEKDLEKLMHDMQESFKCLGVSGRYSWKKGEGCVIKGSDTTSYRGKVLQILGGEMIKVQYVDFGYIEKTLMCHASPNVFNADVPRFCIPCQLHKTLPVGNKWQPDAIELLKELLLERSVKVHVVETPTVPGGIASVYIYCNNASVSCILEQYAHCIPEDSDKRSKFETSHEFKHCLRKIKGDQYSEANMFRKSDLEKVFDVSFESLLSPEWETPILPKYTVPSLPNPEERFPVKVRHIQKPNEVYISMNLSDGVLCDIDDTTLSFEEDSLMSRIIWINRHEDALLDLTDFRPEMPCLAEYSDGKLYRAKLLSVACYEPPKFFVEFVDYGSTKAVETDSLFQMPADLMQYPVEAIKVNLAGLKPPSEELEMDRLPYSPEWSIRAVEVMMDILEKKIFLASRTGSSSELSVFLYEETGDKLVYELLVEEGLADFDQ